MLCLNPNDSALQDVYARELGRLLSVEIRMISWGSSLSQEGLKREGKTFLN